MCHAGVVPLTCFSTKQICLLQKKGGKESKMEAMTWGEGEGWHRKQFITSGEDGLGGACFLGKQEDWNLGPFNLCQGQLDVVSTCNLGTRGEVHTETGAPGPA